MAIATLDRDNPPKTFTIAGLVETAIQPFSDQTQDEWFSAAVRSLKRGGALDAPVVLSSEGRLIDGYHRCLALQKAGRKVLSADQFIIRWDVTAENELDAAVQLNSRRRHLTMEDRAAAARRLRQTYGWTQSRIAKAFGVTQPTVHNWLFKVQTADDGPVTTIGEDGRVRTFAAPSERSSKPRDDSAREPGEWRRLGPTRKALDAFVVRLRRTLVDEPTPGYLRPDDREELWERIEEARDLLAQVEKGLDPDGDLEQDEDLAEN